MLTKTIEGRERKQSVSRPVGAQAVSQTAALKHIHELCCQGNQTLETETSKQTNKQSRIVRRKQLSLRSVVRRLTAKHPVSESLHIIGVSAEQFSVCGKRSG